MITRGIIKPSNENVAVKTAEAVTDNILPIIISSEEILVEIMESYQNFSKNPDKSVEIIWNNAHKDNKEVTGPIDRFKLMLTSEPYNSIIDLTDYSYETIQKDSETVHYEIKILNNKNEYFIVTWVFVFDECELSSGMCWQTIGVSPPMYFDSGI